MYVCVDCCVHKWIHICALSAIYFMIEMMIIGVIVVAAGWLVGWRTKSDCETIGIKGIRLLSK